MRQLDEGLHRTPGVLVSTLPVARRQLDQWAQRLVAGVRRTAPDPITGAATVAEAVGGVLLVLVLLFFLLKDGRPMWRWILGPGSGTGAGRPPPRRGPGGLADAGGVHPGRRW